MEFLQVMVSDYLGEKCNIKIGGNGMSLKKKNKSVKDRLKKKNVES